MNLAELIIDIDYQEKYTYEQRVDIFNKYGISTSLKFLVPIWGLSEFLYEKIQRDGYYATSGRRFWDFGHGQMVLLSDVTQPEKKTETTDHRKIKAFPKKIDIWRYYKGIEEDPKYNRLRKTFSFDLENKILSVNNQGFLSMCTIPRNLYQLIDEWLIDFGYSKWQEDV